MEEIAFALGGILTEDDWRKGILHKGKNVSKSTEPGNTWGMYGGSK